MSELVWCLITRNYYQVTTITINYQQDEPFYYFFKKKRNLVDMLYEVTNNSEDLGN